MFSLKEWKEGNVWRNWSKKHEAIPNIFALPRAIEEVCQLVKKANTFHQTIRVTGAAHSFSPVAMPEHIALSLHELRGLISINQENHEATFYAGTYLHEIGPMLEAYGYALMNMGDIDSQSLAGVISTGTHGTGIELGSFSDMVVKWGFVNGLGEYIEHERKDDELSKALHVSVGLLGILVTVTIKIIPIYNLQYVSTKENLLDILPNFHNEIRSNRHLEWYYFPSSETVQVKRMNMMPYQEKPTIERSINEAKTSILENGVFYLLSEACRINPSFSKSVGRLSAKGVTEMDRNDVSYKVFSTPRKVRFNETEHAIRIDRFEEALEEIHWTFVRSNLKVHFPIECRTTKGEDGYLSPTLGKESAFIAFHMYHSMDEKFYFQWVRDLMKKYDSRPHWGKINWYDKENIYELYPEAAKFNEIRKQMDPNGVFLTKYFKNVFEK